MFYKWVNRFSRFLAPFLFTHAFSQERISIHLEIFHGREVLPLLPLVHEWSNRAFREPPYLYAGFGDNLNPYDAIFADDPEGLVILAKTDSNHVVGIATSLSFDSKSLRSYLEGYHPGMYQEMVALGFDPSSMLYLFFILTAPSFQDPSLSRLIFKSVQDWATTIGKKQICWWEYASPHESQLNKIETWKEDVGGFRRMNLQFKSSWPTYQADGSIKDEEHLMEFFIRDNKKITPTRPSP